jgi:hypothetical protein
MIPAASRNGWLGGCKRMQPLARRARLPSKNNKREYATKNHADPNPARGATERSSDDGTKYPAYEDARHSDTKVGRSDCSQTCTR